MHVTAAKTFCLGALLGWAAPAWAQDNPVVVELYTAQGCASCPPADTLLDELVAHTDVLPLALHVDYWDYIGWEDTFGQARFTKRQHAYARKMGRASVYTPQMVIAGMDEVQGNDSLQVLAQIRRHMMDPFGDIAVDVALKELQSGAVAITVQAGDILPFATDVQLVRYVDAATVEITGGENDGRTVTYRNVVTHWDVLGSWTGVEPFHHELPGPIADDQGLAVIVQEQGMGPILAAGRLR